MISKNRNLSCRLRTARRTMLVNSCYVSRGMGVRKVSNSKSDLKGHSRPFAIVLFDRPHAISYSTAIATLSLSCTVSETKTKVLLFIAFHYSICCSCIVSVSTIKYILSLIVKNLRRSRDSKHIPFEGNLSYMH